MTVGAGPDRPDFRLANVLAEGLSAVNHASLKLCPVDRPRMMHGDGWAASKKTCSQREMPDSAVCPISAAQQITTKTANPSSTVLNRSAPGLCLIAIAKRPSAVGGPVSIAWSGGRTPVQSFVDRLQGAVRAGSGT